MLTSPDGGPRACLQDLYQFILKVLAGTYLLIPAIILLMLSLAPMVLYTVTVEFPGVEVVEGMEVVEGIVVVEVMVVVEGIVVVEDMMVVDGMVATGDCDSSSLDFPSPRLVMVPLWVFWNVHRVNLGGLSIRLPHMASDALRI